MIYTTREININGSTATIDEDIYLFKQDSNIELKFIINDTRFTFQTVESSNVVESSNASYFRVKLLNPYGKTINFPIQEVTDNYIVLLITGELIDEDTEVGDYTIQIRLYDKDKNSKLTLPAIANCIHIQQPIFSEVEESTVDTAAIDTASVMESDEGELPVVDSTGKYIPTLWDTGDTISKAKINHIEKGILQAHTDALADKLQILTAPEGTSKSEIIALFNELPEFGFVYIKGDYLMTSVPDQQLIRIYGLCSVSSYSSTDEQQHKVINCYSEGYTTTINSSGDVINSSFNNVNLKTLMSAVQSPPRQKGKVLTMLNDDKYGWADTIPHITPPDGHTESDIVTFYNELPESGIVFIKEGYSIGVPKVDSEINKNVDLVGLCSTISFTSEDAKQCKTIICYSTTTFVQITSTGEVLLSGICNEGLNDLMKGLESPTKKKGQVLTMISDNKYGWADVPNTIPQITPPKGQTTSDIVTVYNELPEKGLVYFTDSYNISDAYIIGLCYIDPYMDNQKPAKTIICTSTAIYVNITSTGDITGTGVTNNDLDKFITDVLKNPTRQKGQVLTMKSDSEYGWGDVIPQITPPKDNTESDLVTLYNMLPDKGLVYITKPYPITDDVVVGSLCEVATSTTQLNDLSDESTGDTSQNSKSVKTIVCYITGISVDITSTGVVKSFGMSIPEFNDLMGVLTSQAKKKGQVLTMIDDNTFDWADTTPKLCIHNITGNAEVQLTLDPYQLINISDATPQDLSPKYTVDILTPNIEESDNHVYKIHLIFTGYSNVNYMMPSGVYNYPTDDFTAEMVYEFIFTYVKPKWLVNGSEYSIKYSSEPQ